MRPLLGVRQGHPHRAFQRTGHTGRSLPGLPETLIAEPSSDYSSVEAARAALEPALHAGEASGELNQGLRFSFNYTGSAVHAVVSSQQRAVAIDDVVALSDAVQVSRVLGEFRSPTRRCPRREAWLTSCDSGGDHNGKGRERLSGACYAIPTGLESNLGGNLDKAATRLSVDRPVLSTIGKLTARENPVHGRRTGRQEERPDRSRKQRSSGWRLSRRASSDGRSSTKRRCLPSRKSLWPIYHRYPTNGHHRCVPQDGSDQGQRRWLLIEGLFAAVQPIR